MDQRKKDQREITVAIVDDEKMFRVLTRKKLEEVMKRIPLSFKISEYNNGEEFLKSQIVFDIVFMDIAMPEISGLETAMKYRKYCAEGILIFLTACEEYIKEGYKVNAFRYLGKQDSAQEFLEAVKSAVLLLQSKKSFKFELVNGGAIFVSLEDVLYFEAQTRSVLLHLKNGDILPIRSKISELTQMLTDQGFYLIHRFYLVNLCHVRSTIANEVVLSSSETLPISERRYQDFKLFAEKNHAFIQ